MNIRSLKRPSRNAVILAASASTVMSGAAIAPSIPAIQETLSSTTDWVDLARISLIFPAIIVMLFGPIIGRVTSKFDQKKVLVLSLLFTALFGAAGGLATGYTWLLLTRAGLGFATGAVLCTATSAIASHYSGVSQGKMVGAQMATNTFGGVVFVLVGGLLSELAWQGTFSLYLLALPIAYFAFALSWNNTAQDAIVNEGASILLSDREPIAFIMIAMTAFYLIPTQIPFLKSAISSPSAAGLAIAVATLISGIASLLARKVTAVLTEKLTLWVGLGFIVLGLVEIAISVNLFAVMIACGLVGVGFGLIVATAVTLVLNDTVPHDRSRKSGWIASALYSGQVFAMFLASSLDAIGNPSTPFGGMAAIMLIGMAAKLIIDNLWHQKISTALVSLRK